VFRGRDVAVVAVLAVVVMVDVGDTNAGWIAAAIYLFVRSFFDPVRFSKPDHHCFACVWRMQTATRSQ
jgi:hypothetical protein